MSDDPERTAPRDLRRRGLRRMLTGVYETLRSAGRELVLEVSERPGLDARIEELREAARCVVDDTAGLREGGQGPGRRGQGPRAARASTRVDRLLDLSDVAARGGPREAVRELRGALVAVEQTALDELARDHAPLLRDLLSRFADAYAAAKAASRRSTSRISS